MVGRGGSTRMRSDEMAANPPGKPWKLNPIPFLPRAGRAARAATKKFSKCGRKRNPPLRKTPSVSHADRLATKMGPPSVPNDRLTAGPSLPAGPHDRGDSPQPAPCQQGRHHAADDGSGAR